MHTKKAVCALVNAWGKLYFHVVEKNVNRAADPILAGTPFC